MAMEIEREFWIVNSLIQSADRHIAEARPRSLLLDVPPEVRPILPLDL